MNDDNVFPLHPTPEHASDETVSKYFDLAQQIVREHAEKLKADPTLAERLDRELWNNGPVLPSSVPVNAETLFHVPKTYVIDLQRKYAFQFRVLGTLRCTQYECIDLLTFDPDPESSWHLIGLGDDEAQAKLDLLEQIAYQVAHEDELPKPRASRVIHSSQFEPPEYSSEREPDPDDVDFDDGFPGDVRE